MIPTVGFTARSSTDLLVYYLPKKFNVLGWGLFPLHPFPLRNGLHLPSRAAGPGGAAREPGCD